MKIKKNWLQFKEPQAPLTQSASDRSLSGNIPDDNTNDHNNIEVLPWLNDEELSGDDELSDDESDKGLYDKSAKLRKLIHSLIQSLS